MVFEVVSEIEFVGSNPIFAKKVKFFSNTMLYISMCAPRGSHILVADVEHVSATCQ